MATEIPGLRSTNDYYLACAVSVPVLARQLSLLGENAIFKRAACIIKLVKIRGRACERPVWEGFFVQAKQARLLMG